MTRDTIGASGWLAPLAALVHDRLGLDFPPPRWRDLESALRAAAREAGTDDAPAYAWRLLRAPPAQEQLELLAQALTIGETYFFREARSFEVLEQDILPALIAQRAASQRSLRLWSAGCCTGEEAYSLAIVVDRLLPRRDDWDITILGTDVNPRFLKAAAGGQFGAWSFRDAPAGLQRGWFTPVGRQRFAITERIRAMVKFAPLNLVGDRFPDWRNDTCAMDVILCRNVLMYFSHAQAQRVLAGFERALVEGGWLGVSATETSVGSLHSLQMNPFDGAVFYRKSPARDAAARPRSPAAAGPAQPHALPPPMPAVPPAARVPAGAGDSLAQARAHADAGRLDQALASVGEALARSRLDAAAHHLQALILAELGRCAEARAALTRALYLEPDFVLAHHALAQLALRGGKPQQARRHFRHAVELLATLAPESVVPHSGGLAAGQLRALIEAALQAGGPA